MDYLDTNIILRYITRDDPQQAQRAEQLIEQLEAGAVQVRICEAVIVEAVYVLSSKILYNVPRPKIATDLKRFINLKGLKLLHKRVYIRALDLYSTINIDFTDALIVAHMEREKSPNLYSFDQDFDRMQIQTIARLEP